jgi:hypothetical protein
LNLLPTKPDRALNEMIQNVNESTQDLSTADIDLFERIHEVGSE